MNRTAIISILSAIVSLAVIYILIFGDAKDNPIFWGLIAAFFVLILLRQRMKVK